MKIYRKKPWTMEELYAEGWTDTHCEGCAGVVLERRSPKNGKTEWAFPNPQSNLLWSFTMDVGLLPLSAETSAAVDRANADRERIAAWLDQNSHYRDGANRFRAGRISSPGLDREIFRARMELDICG